MKPMISAHSRRNLSFEAPHLGAFRTNEKFDQVSPSSSRCTEVKSIVENCLQLLDVHYWPTKVTIDLESDAEMIFPDGYKEHIPISLIASQQHPPHSNIRMGMFELSGDDEAFRSILAHEMGHMLPEWACRKTGVTALDEPYLNHWSKPIYEGVADWTGAVISGSTTIGSNNIWFRRDILALETLSESEDSVGAMAKLISDAVHRTELIKFRAYREWVDLVNKHFGDKPDPYTEGQWIAKELWQLSAGRANAQQVCDSIIRVAISGRPFTDANSFLGEIKSFK